MKFLSSTSSSEWSVPLRVLVRMVVLVTIVVCLWVGFALYTGLAEPEPFLGVLDQAAAQQPELLLMGDSTLFWRGPDENDSPSLEDAIAATYPSLKVSSVSEAALTLDMMEASWRYLRARGTAPRLAVVVVNLRSFSPTWYERPDSYTEKLLHQLTWDSQFVRALYRPLVEFDVLNKKALNIDEYYRMLRRHIGEAPATYGLSAESAPGATVEKLGARESYYLCYGLPIDTGHPLLRAMRDLVQQMRADGVKVLLYITPVDLERGEADFGTGMVATIGRNRETIKQALVSNEAQEGVNLVDLANLAPTEEFLDHGGAPNEHLTSTGRARLWKALKPQVGRLLTDP
jgi:hypothetical protein